MHSRCVSHLDYRILRYLKSSTGKGLVYSRHGNLDVDIFILVGCVGHQKDISSTSS